MEKVRFLIIGVGGMGREHIRRLLQVPEAEIVALADPSGASIDQVKDRFPELANGLSGCYLTSKHRCSHYRFASQYAL